MKSLKPYLLALLFILTSLIAHADSKPNFIVIFCDDLGYGDLGCFGNPTIRTPNLDRLAEEGQRWTSFYVGASVCTPSRAALLTGRLPVRNGMMSRKERVLFPDSTGGLPSSEITIAEALKPAGYATAAIGKWHLGHLPRYLPTTQGFDSYWGIPYSNDMDAQRGFPSYRQAAINDPHYQAPIDQFNVPILNGTEEIERPADQRTLTRRYTDKAIEFIEAHHDEPFFIYLAHNLPHIPLFTSKEFLGKSRRGIYGDVIHEIDAGTGRIIETLKKLGIEKNTLVVFTSDNGPWLPFETHGGSAGFLHQGKGTTFEGGMRVPAIFWMPGTVTPGIQMDPGTTMDLLPTFCSLAGSEAPTDRVLDGFDLSATLRGETAQSPRDTVFYWRTEDLYAVRVGPWKVHFTTEGAYGIGSGREDHQPPELYNLDTDPSEKYNVAALHPDVIERLTRVAEQHRQSIEPVPNQLDERIKAE